MKQTWKKLIGLVSAGILTLSLAGCSIVKTQEINETVAQTLDQYSVSTMESLVGYSAEEMQATIDTNPALDDFVVSAFEAWMDSSEELGAYQGYEDVSVKLDSNQYVVKIDAQFANRDAEVELVYDSKLNPESIGFSPYYSMSEKIMDAVMNAIVGLGTVFIVLIFLTFVISLMKYVPGLVESFGKKKVAEAVQEPVPAAPAAVQEPVEEELADDQELVAVIAAAVAAYEGTSADGFVVRSIRKSKKRNWR